MKKNSQLYIILAAVGLMLSSCYKKFDPATYAPPLNIGGYTSSGEIASGNLIAYWAFNGSLIDSVSKTASESKGTTFSAGIKGQALQGADKAYALFTPGSTLQSLQSFTVTMWVNSPQNTNGIVGLVGFNNANSFWGNLDIFFENGSNADTAILKAHVFSNGKDAWLGNYKVTNVWGKNTNIALSYNGADTFKIYVNGSSLETKVIKDYGKLAWKDFNKVVFGTVQFQTTPSLTSAADAQSWASFLKGTLDEVRVYNRALTDKELGALITLEGRNK
ncbi:MAG TPA: LamG-like jellyroll fold domain-containing protein [Chitinophaga sp.]|uniref:LamG-like jellyroll fold domain-containing protein n=1 Tax=Chitinophaga sp. TaxID=1869181 RepID=UPI002C75048A|nr:LamG-like jellyroll fold domain-containing protein [Chitinophaga sp.]HVI49517.1 LamG-like jellyroll fold domain-containing protein [Chitinophaga sp.]